MNSVNFNDPQFINSQSYQNFIKQNPGKGYLNIRAYAANSAIPISGLQITVSKTIDNLKVIFFEGATDNSGIISQIALPAPLLNTNNMEIPASTEYDIVATKETQKLFFKISMYSDIQVIQNINLVEDLRLESIEYVS